MGRPLRADAERNRRRILRAADDLFTSRGLDVGLDEIARHAGVGTATVYRRFPDKTELVRALFEERLDRLHELAEKAAAHEDPWHGLVLLVESFVAVQIADRGLKDVIFGEAGDWSAFRERRERLVPIAEFVLRRAQAAGVVRDDLELTDLAVAQLLLGQVGALTEATNPGGWRRQLTLLLDALRPHRDAPTPLPAAAPTVDDFEQLCGRRP
ncbi:MAG TPA: helix-turn-helix domain-containing protein [Pseudonocardiaceae bacterium]